MKYVVLVLFVFVCNLVFGQNVHCQINGKRLDINENYIRFDNHSIIRVHIVLINIDKQVDITSYEWHSKLYKYMFEWENTSTLLFIAREPKSDMEVQVWQIDSYKFTTLQNNNLVQR